MQTWPLKLLAGETDGFLLPLKPSCEIHSLNLGTPAKQVQGHLGERAGGKQEAPLLIQNASLPNI